MFDQTTGVAASNPALFTADTTGLGQIAAVNPDGTLNSPANPAPAGSVLMLFATGEGQSSPAAQDGTLAGAAAAALPHPKQSVAVAIGGVQGSFDAGGAPGEIVGLMQINVVIPLFQSPGSAVPVAIMIGSNYSQVGLTIAVK